MAEIKPAITSFVLNEFLQGEDASRLLDDTQLIDSGIIDSYGVIRLVKFLEDSFEIHVSSSEMNIENFDTLNLIAAFVNRKQGV